MARYAESTTVPVEKSRLEIESTLARYGANKFGYYHDQQRAMIEFAAKGRHVRFVLPLPDRNAAEFKVTPAKRLLRSPEEQYKAWEAACRQRWRALGLAIKAKLEAVECGISEFEEEFLAHIVLPNHQTVGQWLRPQIEEVYATGGMPQMLALPAPEEH